MNEYKTSPGESVAGIALRELKNERRWVEIRDLNSAQFPDMSASDYYPPGSIIALPEKDLTVRESLIKEIATEFFRSWYNSPGTNTDQGFDDWWKLNKARFGF